MKDLKNHHDKLINELDILVEDRNALQEKLNETTEENLSSNALLSQIDEWQQTTIEKIKHAAHQARQQVTKILDSKRSEITADFEKFSKELIRLKETEDFYHEDLTRLQQMILQLDEDLKWLAGPSTVVIHTEHTNLVVWNRLIYVEQKITTTEDQQQEPQQRRRRRAQPQLQQELQQRYPRYVQQQLQQEPQQRHQRQVQPLLKQELYERYQRPVQPQLQQEPQQRQQRQIQPLLQQDPYERYQRLVQPQLQQESQQQHQQQPQQRYQHPSQPEYKQQ